MRKTVEHRIPYVDDLGASGTIDITISFVPNIAIKMYNDIIGVIESVRRKWDEMQFIMADMAAVEKEKPSDWKNKLRELQVKYYQAGESIREKGDQYFFDKRMELVFLILKKNGITEPKYFDVEFWDNCVDPSDILEFINVAIWKDDSKKKVLQ